jgi:hypothetical protein
MFAYWTVFLELMLQYSWWMPLGDTTSNAGISAEVSDNASAKTHARAASC